MNFMSNHYKILQFYGLNLQSGFGFSIWSIFIFDSYGTLGDMNESISGSTMHENITLKVIKRCKTCLLLMDADHALKL